MKELCLSACFCLLFFNVHAQSAKASPQVFNADTASKVADSVYVPLKYCDVHKRSPVLACLLSASIPGLGQVYNKQVLKGSILFGTAVLSFSAAEIYYSGHSINPYNGRNRPQDAVTAALLVPMAAAYVYSIIDAPVTASWLNRTYHLRKKKRPLTTVHIEPGLMNLSPDRYTAGLNLVLR
jgi:hypothetical protein